jgi:hypothetical protein
MEYGILKFRMNDRLDKIILILIEKFENKEF